MPVSSSANVSGDEFMKTDAATKSSVSDGTSAAIAIDSRGMPQCNMGPEVFEKGVPVSPVMDKGAPHPLGDGSDSAVPLPRTPASTPGAQLVSQLSMPAEVITDHKSATSADKKKDDLPIDADPAPLPPAGTIAASADTKIPAIQRKIVESKPQFPIAAANHRVNDSPESPATIQNPAGKEHPDPQKSSAQNAMHPDSANHDSQSSPNLSTASMKTFRPQADAASQLNSATQNATPEKSGAPNSADGIANTRKSNTAAKAAASRTSALENSAVLPKSADAQILPVANIPGSHANSQSGSIGPDSIPVNSVVQNAGSPSVKPDPIPVQPKTEVPVEAAAPREIAPVQVARIFHGLDQSQMHVGLRTESFGAVEVRTSISDKQVEIALGSERGDLKGFMASELPILQNNLQQHDLRLQTLRTVAPGYVAQSDVFSGNGGQANDSPRHGSGHGSAHLSLAPSGEEHDDDLVALDSGLSVRI